MRKANGTIFIDSVIIYAILLAMTRFSRSQSQRSSAKPVLRSLGAGGSAVALPSKQALSNQFKVIQTISNQKNVKIDSPLLLLPTRNVRLCPLMSSYVRQKNVKTGTGGATRSYEDLRGPEKSENRVSLPFLPVQGFSAHNCTWNHLHLVASTCTNLRLKICAQNNF